MYLIFQMIDEISVKNLTNLYRKIGYELFKHDSKIKFKKIKTKIICQIT